jgi:hypothetical protein
MANVKPSGFGSAITPASTTILVGELADGTAGRFTADDMPVSTAQTAAFASASHTHATGDVTGLDTAIANSSTYKAIRAASATGNITSSDRLGLVVGTGTSVTLTMVASGYGAGDWTDVKNANADNGNANQAITLAVSGSEDINADGTTSVSIAPGDTVRIMRAVTSGSPQWQSLSPVGYLALGANQMAVVNSAGTAQEARTQKRAYTVSLAVTADGTYQLPPWPDMPATGVDVQSHTWGGTCSIKIQKAGADANGYGSAVAQTTSLTTTTSTETYTKGAKMQVVVSSASSLTGLAFTINAVQTGA